MLVALYARHSTDKQSKSTMDQIARLREHCDQRGYTVVEAFIDEAKSGADMPNRDGIRYLLDRSRDNIFERVLCEDLSRLSRDQSDIAWLYKNLDFLKISIETLAEGAINELHIGLKGTMNALYLKDLADKTHRGVMAAVRKGGAPGGLLYGYNVVRRLDDEGEPVRGEREINLEEAEIVRRIFAEYAVGKTLRAICRGLNDQGIDAPKGGRWIPTTLVGTASRKTGLLRQTQYKGIVTFNKMSYRKHPETGKRLSVVRPENEWLLVSVPELTIIDPDLFDQVQKILEDRSSLRDIRKLTNKVLTDEEKANQAVERQAVWRARQLEPRKNVHTVVSGRTFCGTHGDKIAIVHTTKNHGAIYGCLKGCPNHNIKLSATIMPLVIAALMQINEATVEAFFASPKAKAERERLQARIGELKPQLVSLRTEVGNVISALGRKANTEELRDYFDKRSMEIRRIKLDLESHDKQLALLTGPAGTERLKAFRFMVNRLRAHPLDRAANMALRPVIKRIILNSEWREIEENWYRIAQIEIDYEKLLKMSIPKGVIKDE